MGNTNRVSFLTSKVKEHLTKNSERLLGLSKGETDRQHGVLALRCFSHIMRYCEPSQVAGTSSAEDGSAVIDKEEADSTEALAGTHGAPEITAIQTTGNETESDINVEVWSDGCVLEDSTFKYVIKHWLRHGSKATEDVAELLSQEDIFWGPISPVRMFWLTEYEKVDDLGSFKRLSPKGLSALHVASAVGFPQLVSALLKNHHSDELHTYDASNYAPVSTRESLFLCGKRIWLT